MATPYHDIVTLVGSWIATEVPAAAGWTLMYYEPQTMDVEPSCAIFFTGDVPRVQYSTMVSTTSGTTQGGWLDVLDNYAVRYWEPVGAAGRGAIDDAALKAVEDLFDTTRAVVFNHAVDAVSLGSMNLRYAGGRMFNQDAGEALLRGFQFGFTADKPIGYT